MKPNWPNITVGLFLHLSAEALKTDLAKQRWSCPALCRRGIASTAAESAAAAGIKPLIPESLSEKKYSKASRGLRTTWDTISGDAPQSRPSVCSSIWRKASKLPEGHIASHGVKVCCAPRR